MITYIFEPRKRSSYPGSRRGVALTKDNLEDRESCLWNCLNRCLRRSSLREAAPEATREAARRQHHDGRFPLCWWITLNDARYILKDCVKFEGEIEEMCLDIMGSSIKGRAEFLRKSLLRNKFLWICLTLKSDPVKIAEPCPLTLAYTYQKYVYWSSLTTIP